MAFLHFAIQSGRSVANVMHCKPIGGVDDWETASQFFT